MQKLSSYSLPALRTLEAQIVEELNKRHFLGVSQAREQILHIARGAGISALHAGPHAPARQTD